MPATIKDIRDETGLSLATISKYLNGGNVLPKNKEKIDAAVEKLHYQVNEIARGLVTNKTRTIGVVVHNIAGLFNGTLAGHIGKALRKEGYGMLVCDSAGDVRTEVECVQFLVNKKVDGMIIVPTSDSAAFMPAAEHAEIPVVLLDRKVAGIEVDTVTIDNVEAARAAVQYLIDHGHRKIALICGEEFTGIEREKGFREAMQNAGISIREEYCMRGNHTVTFGYQSMKELMNLDDPPTAIFLTNYDINLGTVMALNEIGVKCPEEVSLIGFDDLLLPRIVQPHLTVMKQPMQKLAETAVDITLRRVRGEESEPQNLVLEAELLEANSVRNISDVR